MNSEYKDYKYSDATGGCTYWECTPKSREYSGQGRRIFKEWFKANPALPDKNTYRLFKINPFAFWRYGMYIFESRYHLPYRNWEDIEKVRGKIENKSGFQDF